MIILAILILSAAVANNNFEIEFNKVKVWALTGSHQAKVNEVKIQNTDKHLEELDKKVQSQADKPPVVIIQRMPNEKPFANAALLNRARQLRDKQHAAQNNR